MRKPFILGRVLDLDQGHGHLPCLYYHVHLGQVLKHYPVFRDSTAVVVVDPLLDRLSHQGLANT